MNREEAIRKAKRHIDDEYLNEMEESDYTAEKFDDYVMSEVREGCGIFVMRFYLCGVRFRKKWVGLDISYEEDDDIERQIEIIVDVDGDVTSREI